MPNRPGRTGSKTPRLRRLWDCVTDEPWDELPNKPVWKDEEVEDLIPESSSVKVSQGPSQPAEDQKQEEPEPMQDSVLESTMLPPLGLQEMDKKEGKLCNETTGHEDRTIKTASYESGPSASRGYPYGQNDMEIYNEGGMLEYHRKLSRSTEEILARSLRIPYGSTGGATTQSDKGLREYERKLADWVKKIPNKHSGSRVNKVSSAAVDRKIKPAGEAEGVPHGLCTKTITQRKSNNDIPINPGSSGYFLGQPTRQLGPTAGGNRKHLGNVQMLHQQNDIHMTPGTPIKAEGNPPSAKEYSGYRYGSSSSMELDSKAHSDAVEEMNDRIAGQRTRVAIKDLEIHQSRWKKEAMQINKSISRNVAKLREHQSTTREKKMVQRSKLLTGMEKMNSMLAAELEKGIPEVDSEALDESYDNPGYSDSYIGDSVNPRRRRK